MELGMIGLGKMGARMAERLSKAGHRVIVFDQEAERIDAVAALGASPSPRLTFCWLSARGDLPTLEQESGSCFRRGGSETRPHKGSAARQHVSAPASFDTLLRSYSGCSIVSRRARTTAG